MAPELARGVVLVAGLLGACSGSGGRGKPPLADLEGTAAPLSRAAMARELEADIIDSYARDDAPPPPMRQLDPTVGGARIGVGPMDLSAGFELAATQRRWRLEVPASGSSEIVSKRLEVHIATEGAVGWASDELSWRIVVCGRQVVVPLRYTALFAREGERWLPVVEHLSYAEMPGGGARGPSSTALDPAMSQRALALALDAAAAPLWSPRRPIEATIGVDTIAIGPDLWNELHGEAVRTTALLPGGGAEVVDRRAAAIGTRGTLPTVAYWVGILRAERGAPLWRASLVFERSDRWRVVQAHVSSPIDPVALARAVFGTALTSEAPLEVDCGALTAPSSP